MRGVRGGEGRWEVGGRRSEVDSGGETIGARGRTQIAHSRDTQIWRKPMRLRRSRHGQAVGNSLATVFDARPTPQSVFAKSVSRAHRPERFGVSGEGAPRIAPASQLASLGGYASPSWDASWPKDDCGVGSAATVVSHIVFRPLFAYRVSDLRSKKLSPEKTKETRQRGEVRFPSA